MASTAPYEPYRDEDPTRFRWRLGLRPLPLDAWLQFDSHADEDLALKRDLLARHRATVLVRHNEGDHEGDLGDVVRQASDEVYDLVSDWINTYAPERHVPGQFDDEVSDSLEAAARLVQEDLVLLVPSHGELVLGAGCVCFPNKWDLPSKLGRTMAQIHQPVPRLNDELAQPIDSFLARLSVDRPFWRLGWTVLSTADLYLAVDGTASPSYGTDPAQYVLRVERETLRRLPKSGAVLFTIRTYRTPLGELSPDSAAALATALQALPDDVDHYKTLQEVGDEAIAYLSRAIELFS